MAGKRLRKRTKAMLKTIEEKYEYTIELRTGNMGKVASNDNILIKLLSDNKKKKKRQIITSSRLNLGK